jgi:hypothetical protein
MRHATPFGVPDANLTNSAVQYTRVHRTGRGAAPGADKHWQCIATSYGTRHLMFPAAVVHPTLCGGHKHYRATDVLQCTVFALAVVLGPRGLAAVER